MFLQPTVFNVMEPYIICRHCAHGSIIMGPWMLTVCW